MFVLLSSLRYLLTKQKARSPAVKRVPHAFVQKQNLFCSFYAFVSGIRTGVRSFCTADPVVLAPCLDGSDYSILPKFCKHFLSASGEFLPPIALFY